MNDKVSQSYHFEELKCDVIFRRHPLLLRLRADAEVAAHSRGRKVFRRLRDSEIDGTSLEVHRGNVPT